MPNPHPRPCFSPPQSPPSLLRTAAMSELSECERQSKKQKLAGPDPGSCQRQIPELPPDADELRKRGKLIWHWYDSDDEDENDGADPPGKVFIVDEAIYNAQMAAKKEWEEISARRSSPKSNERKKDTSDSQIYTNPKTGAWFLLKPRGAIPKFCVICKKINDHITKHCPQIDSSTQVPDLSCRLCGKEGHANTTCTYQYYVPKGEQVGRGATLICTCCKKEGCHPGTNDWVGIAVPNYCMICGKRYAHRTEDCPPEARNGDGW